MRQDLLPNCISLNVTYTVQHSTAIYELNFKTQAKLSNAKASFCGGQCASAHYSVFQNPALILAFHSSPSLKCHR